MHKLNNLIGKERYIEMVHCNGKEQADEYNRTRCQGKTLSIALGVIHKALANPNKEIYIYEVSPDGRHQASHNRHLLNVVRHTCDSLGLNHIIINKGKPSIMFNLWSEEYV